MNQTAAKPLLRRDLGPITRDVQVIDHAATGELMRQAREQVGLSLRELAGKLGLSVPYLADLEHGRRNWTKERVQQWVNATFPPRAK